MALKSMTPTLLNKTDAQDIDTWESWSIKFYKAITRYI